MSINNFDKIAELVLPVLVQQAEEDLKNLARQIDEVNPLIDIDKFNELTDKFNKLHSKSSLISALVKFEEFRGSDNKSEINKIKTLTLTRNPDNSVSVTKEWGYYI